MSASLTPPWPGLGSYAVSKAALDKLVDAWRGEHPELGFTRLVVGECAGGEGDSMTEFASGWDAELAPWRDELIARIASASVSSVSPPPPAPPDMSPIATWAMSDAEYLDRIRLAKHAIADGDAYQLCLTTEADIPGDFDPVEVYRRVRRSSPSHHGAFLRSGGVALLSVDRPGYGGSDPLPAGRWASVGSAVDDLDSEAHQ